MDEKIEQLLYALIDDLKDHLGHRELLIELYMETGRDVANVDKLIMNTINDSGMVERYVQRVRALWPRL